MTTLLEAVQTACNTAWPNRVGLLVAPTSTDQAYAIIEAPPGGTDATTDIDTTAQDRWVTVRVRSVITGRHDTKAARTSMDARYQAVARLNDLLRDAILNAATSISGTGWTVTGRQLLADGGFDTQDGTVNAVRDYALLVTAAPAD